MYAALESISDEPGRSRKTNAIFFIVILLVFGIVKHVWTSGSIIAIRSYIRNGRTAVNAHGRSKPTLSSEPWLLLCNHFICR